MRTDRIGDVVLSLPMISALKGCFPDARVSFLAQSYTARLLEGQPGLEKIFLYRESGAQRSFRELAIELRAAAFDVAVVAYPTVRIAALLMAARIPVRVGTGYRWYSFLFNRRVYEHRKTGERHEAEFNLSLLRAIGCDSPGSPEPRLYLHREASATVDEIFARAGLTRNDAIVVLHPGSGGSARDWPAEYFASLARGLSQKGFRIVVTGSSGEEELVRKVVDESGSNALPLAGAFTLEQLAAFLTRARLFVSNSTGPLHIAAALGIPVVAFYPPIRACSSRRWGPLTEKKIIFEPNGADCPRCAGGPCQGDDCMRLIRVDDVHRACLRLMDSYRIMSDRI